MAGTIPTRRRLAVVIVNYRTAPLVLECLASLHGQLDPERDRVIVVDNASGDGSPDAIQSGLAKSGMAAWVELLEADANRGFSAGNNLGIRAIDAEAYLLLNSDTQVRPGAVAELLRALELHPEAGLIAPRLEWPDGAPQISTFRFHSPVSELIQAAGTGVVTRWLRAYDVPVPISDAPTPFQWASFAGILIRGAVFDAVGLLDEGYFMYYEDVDFCRHARNAGWCGLYWPPARVVHLRGGSSPVKRLAEQRKRRPAYFYASRTRYFRKFYGPLGVWAANGLWMIGRAVSLARELLGERSSIVCEREYRDIWINALAPLKPYSSSRGPA